MRVEFVESSIANSPVCLRNYNSTFEKGRHVPIHLHEECEFLLCSRGAMRIDFIENSALLQEGDIIFINGRIPHSTTTLEDANNYVLLQFNTEYFLPKITGTQNRHLFFYYNESVSNFHIFKKDDPICLELTQYFNIMLKENEEGKNAFEDYIKGYIFLIAACLSRQDIVADTKNFHNTEAIKRLEPLLNYISNHYDHPLTLNELSQAVNISPGHLCRLFKGAVNSTLNHYINFVRIYEASNLLLRTKNTITEICFAVGYTDPVYFDRMFKRFKGCTPTAYRKFKQPAQ